MHKINNLKGDYLMQSEADFTIDQTVNPERLDQL